MKSKLIGVLVVVLWLLTLLTPSPAPAQQASEPQIEVEDLPTGDPAPGAKKGETEDEAPPLPKGFDPAFIAEDEATLKIWNRTIVVLRGRLAGLEPDERVAQAQERITSLPATLLEEEVWSEAATVRNLDLVLVGVQDQVLLPLRREDLDPASSQTLAALGTEVASRIQAVLRAQAEQRHWPTLLRGAGLALGATLLFIIAMWGIVRLRTRFARALSRQLGSRKLHLSGFDLKPYLRNLVRGTVALFSWILILPLAYLWLTYVLKRFPYTRPWGDDLGNVLFDLITDLTVGALGAVPGLFTVFLIFLVTRFLTRIVAVSLPQPCGNDPVSNLRNTTNSK